MVTRTRPEQAGQVPFRQFFRSPLLALRLCRVRLAPAWLQTVQMDDAHPREPRRKHRGGIAAVLPDMPHIKAAGVWRARKPAIPELGGVGLKVFHGEAFRRGQTRRDFPQGFGGPLLLFGGRFPPCPMQ